MRLEGRGANGYAVAGLRQRGRAGQVALLDHSVNDLGHALARVLHEGAVVARAGLPLQRRELVGILNGDRRAAGSGGSPGARSSAALATSATPAHLGRLRLSVTTLLPTTLALLVAT